MEGGKIFQTKEENENISFNSYHTNIKTTNPFSLTFSSNFLSFDSYFFVFVFRTTTEQYLVSHLLVYPEAGIES